MSASVSPPPPGHLGARTRPYAATHLTLTQVVTSLVLTTCRRRGTSCSPNLQTPHRRSERTATQPADRRQKAVETSPSRPAALPTLWFLQSLNWEAQLICRTGPFSWKQNGSLPLASTREEPPLPSCSATLWKSEERALRTRGGRRN